MQQFHARRMRWIALALGAAAGWVIVPAAADERDALIAELQAQVEALQEENAKLRAQLEAEPDAAPPDAAPATDAEPASQASASAAPGPSEPELTEVQRELAAAREKAQRLEAEMVELEKLAGVSAKGELIETAASLFETTHEATGATTVRAKPRRVISKNVAGFSAYYVGGSFTTPAGNQADAAALPDVYRLELYTQGNPDRWLKTVKGATLRLDGRDFDAPVADYEVLDELKSPPSAGRQRTTAGVLARDERLTISLTPDLAERLGRAQTLELILPKAELQLGREHIAMIEALRLRAQKLAEDTADADE
jgi:hypothetical protein